MKGFLLDSISFYFSTCTALGVLVDTNPHTIGTSRLRTLTRKLVAVQCTVRSRDEEFKLQNEGGVCSLPPKSDTHWKGDRYMQVQT